MWRVVGCTVARTCCDRLKVERIAVREPLVFDLFEVGCCSIVASRFPLLTDGQAMMSPEWTTPHDVALGRQN